MSISGFLLGGDCRANASSNSPTNSRRCLLRDVDLVDLADASTILQFQAINEGCLVDAPAPDAAALFELRIMRDYQDLKARRAGIEADITKRGRVHA